MPGVFGGGEPSPSDYSGEDPLRFEVGSFGPDREVPVRPLALEAAAMEPSQAHLASAVEVIRKRIQQIRDRKETIGEQNTKAALIDPLLSALGWDLQEIDEVRREYRRKPQDNPVDYALFLNRTECLLIEAKSLEKDLGDRKWISQNISYAAVVGVKWCVLTNGDEYRIYNSHAEVDVEEKLFRKVSLSGTDFKTLLDTIALLSKEKMRGSLLDELWKAHFIDRKVRLAFESLLREDDAALIRFICRKAGGVTASEARASLREQPEAFLRFRAFLYRQMPRELQLTFLPPKNIMAPHIIKDQRKKQKEKAFIPL